MFGVGVTLAHAQGAAAGFPLRMGSEGRCASGDGCGQHRGIVRLPFYPLPLSNCFRCGWGADVAYIEFC